MTKEKIKMIVECYGRTKTVDQLASDLGIARSYVHALAAKLRKAGLNVAPTSETIPFKEALRELQKESPELFSPYDRSPETNVAPLRGSKR